MLTALNDPLPDGLYFLICRISSNKSQASNKRRTFDYPCWNKHLPLMSAFPLISAATFNAGLIRIVTIFY